MSVCARVRACVHVCVFEPSAATELDRLKPFTLFIESKNVPNLPSQK